MEVVSMQIIFGNIRCTQLFNHIIKYTPLFIAILFSSPSSTYAKNTKYGYHKSYRYAKEEFIPKPRFWGGLEYMNMWENNGPMDIPLVTQNSDFTALGALGETGTHIIYGNGSGRDINYGSISGGRVTLGGWIDEDNLFGLEFSGFLLEKKYTNFETSSPGGEFPIVAVPYHATQPVNEQTAVSGNSLFLTNNPTNISVNTSSQLWSAELNLVYNLATISRYPLQALAGFRYMSLEETLSLNNTIFDTSGLTPSNGVTSFTDDFQTQNNFYGFQLGLRSKSVAPNGITLDVTAKVALGENAEVIDITGNTMITNDALGIGVETLNSGIFAQPTNAGSFNRNTFAVLPEVQIKVGYMITPNVHPYIGYDVMYLNKVVRPGEQINNNINSTESPALSDGATSVTGSFSPGKPTFKNTNFWIQGVVVGFEINV